MKNNKGFTLMELLAVIIVLSAISLVTVTSITRSLYKRDAKECEEQQELAKNAAKIYFSFKGGNSVKVETLIKEGYLTDEKKTDKLVLSSSITRSDSGYSNPSCISQ